MKKILSIASVGVAVMAMAGSAFAATSATTTTASLSATQQVTFDGQHKHRGQLDNQELLSLLKLDASNLQQGIKEGKSLADIAAAQGVEEQKVIDLLVKQASERLDQAVQAGKLTQSQADERKAELQSQIKSKVESKGEFGFKGKRGGQGGHFDDAASVLGMDPEEIRTQLEAGKSLAQIAQDKGISKEDLVSKLLEKEKERLTKMVDQTWQPKESGTSSSSQN
jgi:uncharacterized protein YidB (DUF937 family)